MTYYQAYGLPFIATNLELPAFIRLTELPAETEAIRVSIGEAPETLKQPPEVSRNHIQINPTEFQYALPNVATYYVSNGNQIIIQPNPEADFKEVLLYFYSNCLAAVLYQRNEIPLHVAGVFIEENKVLLLAAKSGTGKSTTALMLQRRGYAAFTDDTALLSVSNNRCFATASYPMMRQWKNTIDMQLPDDSAEPYQLREGIDKFGVYFHDFFRPDKVEVAGIVFLSCEGSEMHVEKLENPLDTFQQLMKNVYRLQWVDGFGKANKRFLHLTQIAQTIPAWVATRPVGEATFESFAECIEQQIIQSLITADKSEVAINR